MSAPSASGASAVRDERMAAALGLALGISFTLCFVTGMISHLIQDPPAWFQWPTRPVNGYRVNQGLHVASGLATIPLLLAKLWVVLPKFFRWPPARTIDDIGARLADGVLVAGGLFLVFSGTGNIASWRPWGFSFTAGHFWAAVAAYGALLVHVAHHGRTARRELRRPAPAAPVAAAAPARASVMSRRGFVATFASSTALVTVSTAGQTVPWLRWANVLGPRRPTEGPQGLAVNKSAASAGVLDAIETDAALSDYRLTISGRVAETVELTLDDLRSMPQHEADLPIACVEGWSASARWRGVRVSDLLERAGAARGATVRVVSLQDTSLYSSSELNRKQAEDSLTLLAMEINGEPLHPDHGRPVRLIGANRPGVQQTKWVAALEVR
jgi:DMSO/TMAO reductase YedYZ molybdopterin-dependent catalytic subunit